MPPAQRAVAARAYELACLAEEVEQSDEARGWVGQIMQDVAPRQARSPHYLSALPRFAFLLARLGQDELVDRIGRLCAADNATTPAIEHTSPIAPLVVEPEPGAAPSGEAASPV